MADGDDLAYEDDSGEIGHLMESLLNRLGRGLGSCAEAESASSATTRPAIPNR
jgi:hypothetical protein